MKNKRATITPIQAQLQFSVLMNRTAKNVEENHVCSRYQLYCAVANAANELGPDHLFYRVAQQLFANEEFRLEREMSAMIDDIGNTIN